MKKQILKIIFFWLGLILILFLLSFIFKPKDNTATAGMEYSSSKGIYAEKENTIDVLYIGNSLIYSGVSPLKIYEEFGFTGYDLSYPMQQIFESYQFLQEALKTQNPKVVVLESEPLFYRFALPKVILAKLSNHFSVFKYHDRWKNLSFKDLKLKVNYTWQDENKGYKYYDQVSGTKNKDYMKKEDKKTKYISFTSISYLDLIKKTCDEHGIKLIMVSIPTVKDSKTRQDLVKKLAKEKNIEYIDLNDELEIDWMKDTRDKGIHLNYIGAYKVSKYLGNYLKNTELLVDRRNDKKYDDWNKQLKKYNELYK